MSLTLGRANIIPLRDSEAMATKVLDMLGEAVQAQRVISWKHETLCEVTYYSQSMDKPHRLEIRPSYDAETLTTTHGPDTIFKSTMSRDLKTPAGKTSLVYIALIRELLQLKPLEIIQRCDTRDSVANGHTKDSIDRKMRWQLTKGQQPYVHAFKVFSTVSWKG